MDILRAGDVGRRPRPESIAVFNRARAEWQKAVYAITDALGDMGGELWRSCCAPRGADDFSLDDFFGTIDEIRYEDHPRLEALLNAAGWLVRTLLSTNRCHPASERGRQDAHAPRPPVGSGLIHRLPLIQAVVGPAFRVIVSDARGRAAHCGGGGLEFLCRRR